MMSLLLLIAKTKGVVVLFSNDTMLCAKAKINNVIACNRKVSTYFFTLFVYLFTSLFVYLFTCC